MHKGGQPNNTNAQKRGAFLRELTKELTQNPEQLRKAIKKLLEQASKGEPWAIQMLADRLDGKPISGKALADSSNDDDEQTKHFNTALEELMDVVSKKLDSQKQSSQL
jgi:hypothetical protein